MSNTRENIKILHEVIDLSKDFKHTVFRAYADNDQVKYFDGVSETFGWHLYDLAKEKELCSIETANELMKLRIDTFRLFLELYPDINDDTELLSIIKNELMSKYFKYLGLGSEQITFTAILLTFTEIYLSFNQQDIFMKYLLSSSNALGIVLANHSYVPYNELDKLTSTPIKKHTDEKKEIAIPLAKRIWSYDKDTNLLMRIQVAALVVNLLPDLGLTIPQVDNWLKKSGEVPPDILKRYAIKDYGNTREENKLRAQLTSKILSDLSPID